MSLQRLTSQTVSQILILKSFAQGFMIYLPRSQPFVLQLILLGRFIPQVNQRKNGSFIFCVVSRGLLR